jgi:hypothetical protein
MNYAKLRDATYLLKDIPNLEFCYDTTRNPMDTFLKMHEQIGNDNAVYLEDDVILTKNFTLKCEAEIQGKEKSFISFFSLKKDDYKGSRWLKGGKFCGSLCYYVPARINLAIIDYFNKNMEYMKNSKDATGYDLWVAKLLQTNKLSYWNVVPNLAQHKREKSIINPKRPIWRQSETFV